jgi:geranylgeranyl diphosphate synthase type 3
MTHILHHPAQQLKGKVSHAYNYWLKVPADKLIIVNEIADIFHYSLVL